jgi:hypothetical protein
MAFRQCLQGINHGLVTGRIKAREDRVISQAQR